MSSTWPGLLDAKYVDAASSTVLLAREFGSERWGHENMFETQRLEDSDDDGVADALTVIAPMALTPYVVDARPYAGQTALVIATRVYSASQAIEVWHLGAAEEDIVLLGSGVPTSEGAAGAASITLASALAEGQILGLRFVGNIETQQIVHVLPQLPQVVRATPHFIPTGQAVTVVLHGANFTASTVVEFESESGATTTLTVTLINSTSISVTVPSQSTAGGVMYTVRDPGEDPEDDAHFSAVACDPADIE